MPDGGHAIEGLPGGLPGPAAAEPARRPRAALFLLVCLVAGIAPHGLPAGLSLLPSLGLATLLGAYTVRSVLLAPGGAAAPVAAMAGPRRPWMWWWPPAMRRR